ncbi:MULTISPECIES: sugar-binding domain-containing protein [Bacteroides]|jgi:hypothetical protein|uniref:glycoside hydrolase family 2 protein n=1 Tax=Bacteroides TaxID=816 RepID=UPI000E5199D0|nr:MULTISPECIES: sugar-binding domain-containing protein [Bacteroides]RHL12956.1 glycoside hydrolase family 2 [Bacteroides sp. AF39-11AC]
MKKRNLLLLLILIINTGNMVGQKSYFFGEHYPQKEDELPKSKAGHHKVTRVPKKQEAVKMEKVSQNTYQLSKGWEMADSKQVIASSKSIFDPNYDTSAWYNATVPGTVLTTLVNQGVYPDPYWGLNNLIIPEDLCRTDWWYRIAFNIPSNQEDKRTFLRFNGINYKAEIWLNYQFVGKMAGAFASNEFEITHYLHKDTQNVLAVRIFPPNNPGIPQEQNSVSHGGNGGVLCLDGPTFICSEGWDWMPGIRDRNIGIWQDVQLIFRKDISIQNVQILTNLPLPETNSAKVTINVEAINHTSETKTADIKIQIDKSELSKEIELKPLEHKKISFIPDEFPQLNIKNPRLWWPNGYGNPELYTMHLSLMQDKTLSDLQTVRFGIRELSYELTIQQLGKTKRILFNPLDAYANHKVIFDNLQKVELSPNCWIPSIKENVEAGIEELVEDQSNPYIIIRVNGKRIFCKGGNWGIDDAMKRSSRERLEPYIRFHKEQGFNMIRNWTAESTEKVFYDLCDEYGILVFNDFGLSTENHNLLPADYDLFLDNVNYIVTRFRNHPSIAIWCPQNEGFPPAYIENGISKIIAEADGTRHYLGNSRTLNTRPSGPWNYIQPTDYYTIAQGFASEVGSPSLPTAESLRKMMSEEDLWPIGDVWYYHDWLKGQWGNNAFIQSYEEGINNQFGISSGVDEFCRKAQLVNYESYRAIFESWNSKLFNTTSGVLLWMSHPAWPSMVWQTYSWDYETPGAYYGAKKACEPVHIQYNMITREIEIVNTSLQSLSELQAIGQIISLQGKVLYEETSHLDISPNQVSTAIKLPIQNIPNECYFVRLQLRDKNRIISQNFYWISDKKPHDYTSLNNIPQTTLTGQKLTVHREKEELKGSITICNTTDKIALAIKLNIRNAKTEDAILPVYFEDGYFSLLPGEVRSVKFELPITYKQQNLKLTAEGYNIPQQDISTTF